MYISVYLSSNVLLLIRIKIIIMNLINEKTHYIILIHAECVLNEKYLLILVISKAYTIKININIKKY